MKTATASADRLNAMHPSNRAQCLADAAREWTLTALDGRPMTEFAATDLAFSSGRWGRAVWVAALEASHP
jgi:hypothetical protein